MVDEATRVLPSDDDGSWDAQRLGAELLRVGPFRLLERLGAGGMGVVYLAERREPVAQRVALKVIRSDRLDRTYLARFAMEQQALARMDHPHVARLLDAGSDDGQAWFAMELVPGVPLTDYCQLHRLSVAERLGLFQQVCDGVQHAHQQGILHRDLKPTNILVREVDGRPVAKIIDFGLAQPVDPLQIRATLHESARTIVGTFAYMSPEQAQRSEGVLDIRTDVYSLGVVLYELLTGELPIDLAEIDRRGPHLFGAYLREYEPARPSTRLSQLGERLSSTAAERRTSPQRLRSQVRGELDWITMKALERDRQRRYATVRDLGRDVDRFQRRQPVEAGPPGVGYVLSKWLRRNWAAAAVVAVIALLLVGGGVQQVVHARETTRLAAEARRAEHPLIAAGLIAAADSFRLDPEAVPELERWLAQVDELLADVDSQRRRFDAGLAPALGSYLAEVVPELELCREVALQLLADVAWLRERAADHASAWLATCAQIEADERYGLARMTPQLGLVPLERDPKTGLFEFEVLDPIERQDPSVPRHPKRGAEGTLMLPRESNPVVVLLPGGRFSMGTALPAEAWCSPSAVDSEVPQHEVVVAPFFVGKFEVTQIQHSPWGDDNPSYWDHGYYSLWVRRAVEAGEAVDRRAWLVQSRDLPVANVTWRKAMRRARRLGLRLCTEQEWEYAARAGTIGCWSCGAEEAVLRRCANLPDASPDRPQELHPRSVVFFSGSDGLGPPSPVGLFEPNPFGLHDMHGNVAEWCADPLLDYGTGLPPDVPMIDDKRVFRGGSALRTVDESRSAARKWGGVDSPMPDLGYRFARDLVGSRPKAD